MNFVIENEIIIKVKETESYQIFYVKHTSDAEDFTKLTHLPRV